MTKKITFLGIETSCDETAAAVIKENDNGTADILSNIVSSQISEHKQFGGVVPELAARAHLENTDLIINTALKESKISINEIDGNRVEKFLIFRQSKKTVFPDSSWLKIARVTISRGAKSFSGWLFCMK